MIPYPNIRLKFPQPLDTELCYVPIDWIEYYWIERGLVNNALGTIKDIVYYLGIQPKGFPQAVMVEFDGPFLTKRFSLSHLFENLVNKNNFMLTDSVALTLAYVATIHKSRGLTLSKIAMDNVVHLPILSLFNILQTRFNFVRTCSGRKELSLNLCYFQKSLLFRGYSR